MSRPVALLLKRTGRMLLLVLLVAIGTVVLTRYAPGYFSDGREMDAQYARSARAELDARATTDHSVITIALAITRGLLHGDFGESRQYGVPVAQLIKPCLLVTASLVLRSMLAGTLFALALAMPLGARCKPRGETLIAASTALLLAIPIGALATLCLLGNTGGPAFVLTVLIGTRNFKFFYRLLRSAWRMPHLLQARAQGIRTGRILCIHLLPVVRPQLLALGTMSFVTALSAVVPAEVIFSVAGLGQLAWTAAMNRDLPVLLAVTLLMAFAVGIAGMFSEPQSRATSGQGANRMELA